MKTETKVETRAAHTPGPWREDSGFIVARFSDGEIHDVCDPRCAPSDSADIVAEMDANARLIAAAPETRTAAEALAKALRRIATRRRPCSQINEAVNQDVDDARAALAQWEELRS